jgi:hypothetical protein
MLPSFNTARKRLKPVTVTLAFVEFSWRKAPTSGVKPTAISIELSVGRSGRGFEEQSTRGQRLD